jgi:hypothetical protein
MNGPGPASTREREPPAPDTSPAEHLRRIGLTGFEPAAGIPGLRSIGEATLTVLHEEGPGQPLPPAVRASMERALGIDLDAVRIHLDRLAQQAAAELSAWAFALGDDVYFAAGAFAPETAEGRELLGRELAGTLRPPSARLDEAPPDPAAGKVVAVPAPGPTAAGAEVTTDVEPLPVPEPEGPPPEEVAAAEAEPAPPEPAAVEAEPEVPAPVEGADVELLMPPPPADLSPPAQQRLANTKGAARRAASATTDLPSAAESTKAARGAVEEPKTETTARAELRLAEVLGERPPPSPQIVALCDAIRLSIREKRPVDEDELVEAEPEKMALQAGTELNAQVQGDAQRVQGSYQELNEPQTGKPLLEPQGIDRPPEAVDLPEMGAAKAAPDPVPAENVSLDADLAATEERIEAAGMNTEPAQAARVGPVAEARAAHDEFAAVAATGPAEALAQQEAALQAASADMTALQQQAVDALATSRDRTVTGVGSRQDRMVGSEEQTRQGISARAREIFVGARQQVSAQLGPLPGKAMDKWNAGVKYRSGRFRARLAEVESWIDERHSGAGGAIVGAWDWLTGLPDWVTEAYDEAEQEFGDGVCALIIEISREVNTVVRACELIIEQARTKIDALFTGLDPDLEEWARQEKERIHGQLDGLHNGVLETRDRFNRDLSRRAVQSVREVQDEIAQLREEAKGFIGRVADWVEEFIDDPIRAIINGLLDLVGIPPPSFWAIVEKVKQAISDIADDPLGFASNLVAAIGQGFQLFFDHFPTHLLQGLLDWLFSGLRTVGVMLPPDFSLKSVITFFLQLMGISWPKIRQLLVRHIGEENVALIEKAWELISTLIEQGPEGIFDLIRGRLDPAQIFAKIMDAAIDYVMEALIEQVTARVLLLFNPVGAIIQAIELIYKVAKWVFQNAARLWTFIETIVNGIMEIVRGNIGGMATAVEMALARLIAPVIDFLAEFFGFSDLPDQVVTTVKGLQGWVESVINTAIAWLAEQGRRLLRAVGLGGEEPEEGRGREADTNLGTSVSFTAAGDRHREWVEVRGTDAVLLVSSDTPMPVSDKLADWESRLEKHFSGDDAGRTEAANLISSARVLLGQADADADAIVTAFARANAARAAKDLPPIPSDDPLEQKQRSLATILARLYDLFGRDTPQAAAVKAAAIEDIRRGASGGKLERVTQLHDLLTQTLARYRGRGLQAFSAQMRNEATLDISISAFGSQPQSFVLSWAQAFRAHPPNAEEIAKLREGFEFQGYETHAAVTVDGRLIEAVTSGGGHAEEWILISGIWDRSVNAAKAAARARGSSELAILINRAPCHTRCSRKLVDALNAVKASSPGVRFILAPTGVYEPSVELTDEEMRAYAEELVSSMRISLNEALALTPRRAYLREDPSEPRKGGVTTMPDIYRLQAAGWQLQQLLARPKSTSAGIQWLQAIERAAKHALATKINADNARVS